MKLFGRNIISSIIWAAIAAVQMISFTSCDSVIYDDLDPCDEGLRLRFVYDYNMEFANAFPSQVDCLTLLVYDKDGNYIETRTVTDRELLSDEFWRMDVDLPAGTYNLLAYGGLQCQQASFAFMTEPQISLQSVEVGMKPSFITSPNGTRLHDLFYGALEVTVPENSSGYTEATVKMKKDTNNVRIVLQHIDGSPVNKDDFTFRVTADNTLLDYKNDIIPVGNTVFCPWAQDNAYAGLVAATPPTDDKYDETLQPVQVAYAEFSLSRFVYKDNIALEITRADGTSIFNRPVDLLNYLLLLKSDYYSAMEPQEYLDRESRWSLVLLLDRHNFWISTTIVVNGWVVRINDIQT